MEFRVESLVTVHPSGRVTVTPLHLPALAYHAPSLEAAEEDLTLAIDDRITRAHPARVGDYARTPGATLAHAWVDAVTVWHAAGSAQRPMRLDLVVSPAQRPYVEVRSLRLDLRVWLPAGDDLVARAAPFFLQHLLTLSEAERLALRPDGDDALRVIVVEAEPTPLSSLRRRELRMDERPPPLPDDLAPPPEKKKKPRDDGFDEPARAPDDDDDDDDEAAKKSRKKKRPPTPTLARVGVALHGLAEKGELGRAWELDAVVDALVARVAAKHPEPAVIVADAGAGKTAVVHELARRLHEATRERPKHERRPFFHVDASRLIAGEGFFGDWQQQTFDVMDEARRAEAVLYFGHAVELLDAGKSAHSDHNVAQLLGPALAAREVAVVAEATPEEWARIERRSASFAGHWAVVRLPDLSPEASRRVLDRVAEELGARRGLAVEADAVEAALRLTRRFKPYGALVGNTVAFLRRAVEAAHHAKAARLAGDEVVARFSGESGIPLVLLRDDMPLDPAAVRDFLTERVQGQRAAVERVTEIVAVIKAGLADQRRPVGVLFFAGPTGVGKTELAKALAEFVFGARERMVRLDMGEYAAGDALARLLGDGGGAGHLTAAVRRQPFSLVLLDEIEKAHPAVFDALLGVLGEGRLTDASGRFTDFRNAILVMTSNLGADTLRARVGFSRAAGDDDAAARAHYRAEAERFFRPELFNRIDDFIVFAALGRDVLGRIVRRKVARLAAREGLRRHNVELRVDDRALEVLADHGFDPRYGARPLERTLERELALPIATRLAERPEHGNARVEVTARGEHLALTATSLTARDEGVTSRALHALESTARLRAEVRRWARCHLVQAMRSEVSFFTKASQAPGFWKERDLAEETARRAERARARVEALDALTSQAEALEDMAFESWYERRDDSAPALEAEVERLRAELAPRKRALFASMFPAVEGVVLYLTAGRSAWHLVSQFAGLYARWCKAEGLDVAAYTAVFVPEEQRPTSASKTDPAAAWKWTAAFPPETAQPLPHAAALAVKGGDAMFLLSGEDGAHRVLDGSGTALLRVRFEALHARGDHDLRRPHTLDELMPEREVRRVSLSKATMKDLRTQREHEWRRDATDLSRWLADWMEHLVFGPDADTWRGH